MTRGRPVSGPTSWLLRGFERWCQTVAAVSESVPALTLSKQELQ